ncbi:MAG: alpha/beta hydrolase, partial [Rhodospirillales bacterium]
MDTQQNSSAAFLNRKDGSTIAYHLSSGKSPGVVFLTGFNSDMTGSKAIALESYCQQRCQAFLRFDYTGHGQSSGTFEDGCIGQWADDAVYAIVHVTKGPLRRVGSSVGGGIVLF